MFQSTRPRGARLEASGSPGLTKWFQSTRPRGARRGDLLAQFSISEFQSTRPRGARRLPSRFDGRKGSFNPRARVGRDAACRAPIGRSGCFNPRARVGRDKRSRRNTKNQKKFQSTHPRGARHRNLERRGRHRRVSIHAPAWGATIRNSPFANCRISFNPRARVGRDISTNQTHE